MIILEKFAHENSSIHGMGIRRFGIVDNYLLRLNGLG